MVSTASKHVLFITVHHQTLERFTVIDVFVKLIITSKMCPACKYVKYKYKELV
jgi:hypothetical protein